MNITRFSIQRPVGISMIVAFFVVLGLYSYYRIGVELLPELNTPYVTVVVKYPGASAESVEQEIVKPVEDALSSVSNVKKITSTASYERARIGLELEFIKIKTCLRNCGVKLQIIKVGCHLFDVGDHLFDLFSGTLFIADQID